MRSFELNPVQNDSSKSRRRVGRIDFQRLGLRKQEARVEVIREAVSRAVADVRDSNEVIGFEGEHEQLAAIATSAYRLLDPRRRTNIVERIHLLLVPELDRSNVAQEYETHLSDPRPDHECMEGRRGVGRTVVPSRPRKKSRKHKFQPTEFADSYEVLAAQDVIEFLRRDRSARIRRSVLGAFVAIVLVAVAMLLWT